MLVVTEKKNPIDYDIHDHRLQLGSGPWFCFCFNAVAHFQKEFLVFVAVCHNLIWCLTPPATSDWSKDLGLPLPSKASKAMQVVGGAAVHDSEAQRHRDIVIVLSYSRRYLSQPLIRVTYLITLIKGTHPVVVGGGQNLDLGLGK